MTRDRPLHRSPRSRAHHLALKTPDIDAAIARVHAAGLRVIDRNGPPDSRRARIGFVQPGALGGVLLHFVERTPP
jgi:catechol 2,3-dioxygenase-like lactoylglutathione lyase family enzyme